MTCRFTGSHAHPCSITKVAIPRYKPLTIDKREGLSQHCVSLGGLDSPTPGSTAEPPAASWMVREAKSEKRAAAVFLTTHSLHFAIGAIDHRCLRGAGAAVGELRFSGADFFDCLAQLIFARGFLVGDG